MTTEGRHIGLPLRCGQKGGCMGIRRNDRTAPPTPLKMQGNVAVLGAAGGDAFGYGGG